MELHHIRGNTRMINTILAQYEQEAYASYENVTGTIIRKPDGSLKNEYGHNDAVDAYRHAYVSAVMTYDSNKFVAYILGTAHEIKGELFGNQPAGQRNMDLWNNSQGRDIGSAASSREVIAQNVFDSLQNGNLITGTPQYSPTLSGWFGISGISNLINTLYLQFKSWTPPRTDPLVLDLDNDGIETIGIGGTVVVFDHNADGIRTGTGWVKSDDGFLVLDRNDNGTIDSGRELFGVDTMKSNGALATNGFEALSELDSNGDQVFDQNDAEFAHVQVWRDFNQNGISTANELFSLSELGIVSFNLNATTQNVNLGNGNVQTASAAHLTVDGTGQTGNLDLANNPFYREFVDTIPPTEQALNLPDNKGSGWVRDLREAASLSFILVSQSFVKIQQGILQ